ncbi:MAG: EamA family transporter [Chloroflexi bacterium]|nr:EamA family transporter [Chloroflexota bacterium]
MEKGLLFAILAAAVLAGGVVFIRRGSALTGESFTSVLISIFIGVPMFSASVSFSGEWYRLGILSLKGFILLGAAGIVHFIVGRFLSYSAYRIIGVNKTNPLINTSPVYAVIFALIFLNESLTAAIILGVLCIVTGAVLVSVQRSNASERKAKWYSGIEFRGVLAGLGGGLSWGISPILIRPGVIEVGSPHVGALISYIAASVVFAFFLFNKQYRKQLARLRFSPALGYLVAGGFLIAMGHLLNYTALKYSPAGIVAGLIGTNVIFGFFFSWLLNRSIEVFNLRVIMGLVVTLAGTLLIFYF